MNGVAGLDVVNHNNVQLTRSVGRLDEASLDVGGATCSGDQARVARGRIARIPRGQRIVIEMSDDAVRRHGNNMRRAKKGVKNWRLA